MRLKVKGLLRNRPTWTCRVLFLGAGALSASIPAGLAPPEVAPFTESVRLFADGKMQKSLQVLDSYCAVAEAPCSPWIDFQRLRLLWWLYLIRRDQIQYAERLETL